jgi:hypothetical protein
MKQRDGIEEKNNIKRKGENINRDLNRKLNFDHTPEAIEDVLVDWPAVVQ